MNKKKYIIVDDTQHEALYLREQISQFSFLQFVGTFSTLEAAKEILLTETIDLVMLDVNLSNESGLDLLKEDIYLPPVILTSTYPDFAVKSYEIGKASDYLLKPITSDRLFVALNRALLSRIRTRENDTTEAGFIFLRMGWKNKRFNLADIDYVEGFGLYSKIFCDGHMYVVNDRLNSLESLLPFRLFLRVHKSYIINLSKMTSFDRSNLWIHDIKIPVGISFRHKLEGLLRLFATDDQIENQ
ncbi:LytR/AlgR family response regulator transcription factor [Spirosoma lituiforme]